MWRIRLESISLIGNVLIQTFLLIVFTAIDHVYKSWMKWTKIKLVVLIILISLDSQRKNGP